MPQDRGAFLSTLDFLNRLSGPVKNVLRGDLGGAGRQTVDLLGDLIDAPLPGDWIPHIARPEDEVTPTELLGVDRKAHPYIAGATDFIGDILLNPTTYIPGAVIAKGIGAAGSGVSKAASLLPEAAQPLVAKTGEALEEGGRLVRRMTGNQRVTEATDQTLRDARGAGAGVAQAGKAEIKNILAGSPKAIREKAFQVINNSREVSKGTFAPIVEGTEVANPLLDIIPKDSGVPLSDIPRMQPKDDYLKIKLESEARGKIDPTDTGVGIEGVATKPFMPFVDKLEAERVIPSFQDEAAAKTLDQAYPLELTDPRYGSGIDVANKQLVGKGKVKSYGLDDLKPSPSEVPGVPTGPAAAAAAREAEALREIVKPKYGTMA